MNNNYDDDDNHNSFVPIAVPVIIEKDRFLRIVARRTSRAPRNTPPLHVTPKTLLTGLCRCGYCKSPMHITTGKSGRYRYLKCNKRNAISSTICASRNVPYDRFEKLILRTIAEYVLSESRIRTILADCRTHADKLSGSQGSERRQVAETKAQVERKLSNLYKLVEDEKVRIDASLGRRIQGWQDELKELTVRLDSIKVPICIPASVIDNIDVSSFRSAALAVLEAPDSEDAKALMHLVVDEIRIYADEANISGPNLGLLEANLTHAKATVTAVPSFMGNWRKR